MGDARVLEPRLAVEGIRATYDPADDVAAVLADAASCRYAPEGLPLLVLSTGSIADWAARQARPEIVFVTPDQVAVRIREMMTDPPASAIEKHSVFVLTYANKGGVGKTTTALGVALALAEGGVPTLLWDLDFGGPDIAGFFKLTPKVDIADVLSGHTAVEKAVVPVRENLWLLPGPTEAKLPRCAAEDLIRVLRSVRARFPVVVGDTPPDPWTKAYLHDLFAAGDIILAVVDQSKFSLLETEKYAPSLLAMGVPPEKIWIVVNRHNPKLTSLREIEKTFCAGFRAGVPVNRLPRVCLTVPEAWEEHVRQGQRGDLQTDPWVKLAQEIARQAGATYSKLETTEKRGLFGWLKKSRTG